MAVELCSESPGRITSPRISFSHDLSQFDIIPVEQHLLPSNSSSGNDFDFCIRENYDQEPSSAEELFSGGKIIPSQIKIKKKAVPLLLPSPKVQQPEHPPPPSIQSHDFDSVSCEISNNEIDSLKESKTRISGSEEKTNSKSFWRFKRSSSLNCGSGYGRSLCPLPLLSRSNSTGSAASVKRNSTNTTLSKDPNSHYLHKPNSQKSSSFSGPKSSQAPPPSSANFQKPPLKKSYGSYGNGVRVNPVLNVPSGNLFGLGSFFSTGGKDKDKNKNKKK